METLAVGDRFIAARYYVDALRARLGPEFGPLRTVDWAGAKEEQHAAQQAMEWQGVDAVPVPAGIVAAAGGAEVLTVHFAPVPAAVLAAAPRLRAVVVARAGTENVDVGAASERGVAVVRIVGRNAGAVAELTLGMMLSEARDIARSDAAIKAGGWRKSFPGPSYEIGGRTVGMVGFGSVGRELARRLSGFGSRILVFDPYVESAALGAYGAVAAGLDEVFVESDFVCVQARLSSATERFIRREHLELMKPTAYFVNNSRSRLVDYDALYDVLAAGRIAGAALDVHDEEPLPPDSRWRGLDNVTLTPHYGGDTEETNTTSARLVAEAVGELAGTGRCANAVNAGAIGWA